MGRDKGVFRRGVVRALAWSIALTGAVGGLGAQGAHAAPAWLAPVSISPPAQQVRVGAVALDRKGDAVAVWELWNGANWLAEAASRPAGGAWQPPLQLSTTGPSEAGGPTSQPKTEPDVTFDDRGDALAVWSNERGYFPAAGSYSVVRASYRPAGGEWQTPVDLTAEGAWDTEPHAAFDARGDAFVVWRRSNGEGHIQVAYRPLGGQWQAPINLSEEEEHWAAEPEVAVDPRGDAVVVWLQQAVLRAAYKPAGHPWQTATAAAESPPGWGGVSPQVALDDRGDALVTWSLQKSFYFTNSPSFIQTAYKPAGHGWQAPVDLTETSGQAHGQQLAFLPNGDALALWEGWDGANWIVRSALRPRGGEWQSPADLSEAGSYSRAPRLAIDGRGDAMAVWQHWSGYKVVQAALRRRGGEWQAPVDLSESFWESESPRVAFSSPNNAVVAWQRSLGKEVIQAAGYERAGP